MRRSIQVVALFMVLAWVATAQANVVSGKLWIVSEAASQNAVPANVPGTTPDVTFDVTSPFNFSGTTVARSTWLASSGAFNIVENTAGTLAAVMDPTIVEFTGNVTVTTGQTFTVTHDDGLTLIIGGLNLGFNPGPTAPVTSTATYTGPSGNFPFQLVYGECCGGPAVLQVDLPFTNVPVPSAASAAVLLGGLVVAMKIRNRVSGRALGRLGGSNEDPQPGETRGVRQAVQDITPNQPPARMSRGLSFGTNGAEAQRTELHRVVLGSRTVGCSAMRG
jgi:hypothetical protein